MIEIKEGNSVGPECLEEELHNGHVFIKSVDFVVWEEIQAGFNQNPADTHPRTTDETSRPSNLSVWRSKTLKSFWWEKLSGLQKLTIIQSLCTYVWILNPKSSRRAEPGIDSHHHPARGSVCEYGAEPTNPPENGRLHSSSSSILSSYTALNIILQISLHMGWLPSCSFCVKPPPDWCHACCLWVSWFSLAPLLIFWLTWRELSDCKAGSGKENPTNWGRTCRLILFQKGSQTMLTETESALWKQGFKMGKLWLLLIYLLRKQCNLLCLYDMREKELSLKEGC